MIAETIRNDHADLFTFLRGDLGATAVFCRQPEQACSQSLVFVTGQEQFDHALRRGAAIVIVHCKLVPGLTESAAAGRCLFSVPAIPAAMAALLKYFDAKGERFSQWGKRHATAVIHESAVIGKNAVIGPYSVIGAEAVIGEDCMIGSHTVIENKARIGAGTILHPHVFVGSSCEIGRNCEVHPHTSIGSDGFGYAVDKSGKPRKIAQLGNVKIADDVEIGSNCAIDRATLTSTHVRSGTKLDNLCHIAHNCDLGENGLYTAGFMTAGSTKIGRQFVTGGQTVVAAHITVADNVVLAGRSAVTNDVTESGAYGGYPLQPLRDALRTAVNIGHLTRLRRDVRRVMTHLCMTREGDAG